MKSSAFVNLALHDLKCSQKELAEKIGVSPTQISNWKYDEYMSAEMELKFREITKIGNEEPGLILMVGSLDQAKKWEDLILYLTGEPALEYECGCYKILETLQQMGVKIPNDFPEELNYRPAVLNEATEANLTFESNPFVRSITAIFVAYLDVNDFFIRNITGLWASYEDMFKNCHEIWDLQSMLLRLAAAKIEVDAEFAPLSAQFKDDVFLNARICISGIKAKAFHNRVPIGVELLDMIYKDGKQLRDELEVRMATQRTGINEQIHPDFYMNEILLKTRAIYDAVAAQKGNP